jgi:two-component system response regulator
MSDLVHVLVVEDDPGDALMVRESFAQAGKNSRFHVVPDRGKALRFLRRAGEYRDAPRPGLVLLDLNRPRLHGLGVLAQIKADPDLMIIPVIVLSSSHDPDDINRSYQLHANAYIVKPRDLDGFTAMIRQVDECFLDLVTPPPAPEGGNRRTPDAGLRGGDPAVYSQGKAPPPLGFAGDRPPCSETGSPGGLPGCAAPTRPRPSNRTASPHTVAPGDRRTAA